MQGFALVANASLADAGHTCANGRHNRQESRLGQVACTQRMLAIKSNSSSYARGVSGGVLQGVEEWFKACCAVVGGSDEATATQGSSEWTWECTSGACLVQRATSCMILHEVTQGCPNVVESQMLSVTTTFLMMYK